MAPVESFQHSLARRSNVLPLCASLRCLFNASEPGSAFRTHDVALFHGDTPHAYTHHIWFSCGATALKLRAQNRSREGITKESPPRDGR